MHTRTVGPRRIVPLILMLAFAACSDSPLSPGAEGRFVVRANLTAGVSVLVVEVTASDIPVPLVFNLPAVDGVASGVIVVRAGSDRLVTVRGFNDDGIETHSGSATIDVTPGVNPTITIRLYPRVGDVPIDVTMGSIVIEITPVEADLEAGTTLLLTAAVYNESDEPIDAVVQWATTHPGRARVDASGLVTGVSAGDVQIVATYQGVAGIATIHVLGEGGGPPGSALTAFSITPDEVDLTLGAQTVVLEARTTAGSIVLATLGLANLATNQDRSCFFADYGGTSGGQDIWTCQLTFVDGGANGPWLPYLTLHGVTSEDWTAAELGAAGFSSSLLIGGSATLDVLPPTLTGLTILTPVVAPGGVFSYQLTATDDLSGLASAGVFVQTSQGIVFLNGVCWSHTLSAGGPLNATFTCSGPSDFPLPAGDYTIQFLLLSDRAGNQAGYTASQLQSMGFTGTGFTIN
jgi:Big-like domain-containing protein